MQRKKFIMKRAIRLFSVGTDQDLQYFASNSSAGMGREK